MGALTETEQLLKNVVELERKLADSIAEVVWLREKAEEFRLSVLLMVTTRDLSQVPKFTLGKRPGASGSGGIGKRNYTGESAEQLRKREAELQRKLQDSRRRYLGLKAKVDSFRETIVTIVNKGRAEDEPSWGMERRGTEIHVDVSYSENWAEHDVVNHHNQSRGVASRHKSYRSGVGFLRKEAVSRDDRDVNDDDAMGYAPVILAEHNDQSLPLASTWSKRRSRAGSPGKKAEALKKKKALSLPTLSSSDDDDDASGNPMTTRPSTSGKDQRNGDQRKNQGSDDIAFTAKENIRKRKNMNLFFHCNLCDAKYTRPDHLKDHKAAVHKIKSTGEIHCLLCGAAFTNRSDLNTHRKENHAAPAHIGNPATDVTSCKSNLPELVGISDLSSSSGARSSPRRLMEDEYQLLANEMSLARAPAPAAPVAGSLDDNGNRSLYFKHGIRKPDPREKVADYYCFCGAFYKNRNSILKHILIKNRENLHKCDACPYRATTIANLKKHMEEIHKDGPTLPEDGNSKNESRMPGICKPVPFVTNINTREKRDDRMHPDRIVTSEKSQKDDSGNLSKKHAIRYPGPGEKLTGYVCLCGSRFKNRKGILHHIKTKNRGKIFKCQSCSHRTDNPYALKVHEKRIHPKKKGKNTAYEVRTRSHETDELEKEGKLE